MKRLVIVQPYIPTYRVPFFTKLVEQLQAHNISATVVAPTEAGTSEKLRGDSRDGFDWHTATRFRRVRIGSVNFTYYGSMSFQRNADAVIAPAAGSCLDSHLAFYSRRRTGLRVGLWGHIGSYVKSPLAVDSIVERRMLNASDHIFAYTVGGQHFAVKMGVPQSRTTLLNNTIDVVELVAARERHDIAVQDGAGGVIQFGEFRGEDVYAFIGGLDESKNVHLLRDTLEVLWRRRSPIKLIVAGAGPGLDLLQASIERGQTLHVGYATASLKAQVCAAAKALVIPGRVGLVAVDALAFQLPIITTKDAMHAPEFEYLTPGSTVFFASGDPTGFADTLETFEPAAGPFNAPPTLANMTDQFVTGVQMMLEDS